MAHVLGLAAKLYRNTGTYASPTWTEITNVKDVTVTMEKGEADVTTRAADGWVQTAATLKNMTIEFQMVWNPGDAGFEAIKDAFMDNTAVELLALDGASDDVGAQGPRASCDVFSFTRGEPLAEALTVDVTCKPTLSDNAPEWFEVPGP